MAYGYESLDDDDVDELIKSISKV